LEISDKVEKTRLSVTMTKAYVDALDYLVGEGLYLNRGEAVLESLRHFFKSYGIEPFATKGAEKTESSD